MREELKDRIADIIRAERNTFINSREIADDIADLIDQDHQATKNKINDASAKLVAIVDEIKAVLNPEPEPEPKIEEVRI